MPELNDVQTAGPSLEEIEDRIESAAPGAVDAGGEETAADLYPETTARPVDGDLAAVTDEEPAELETEVAPWVAPGNDSVAETGVVDGASFTPAGGQEPVDNLHEEDWVEESTAAPRVLVVDRSGNLATEISEATEGLDPEPEILRLPRSTQLHEVVAEERPDVIVFAPEAVTAAGLKRLARIHIADPRIVILLSDSGRQLPSVQIAASGASDILAARPTRPRLRAKLAKALEMARELRRETAIGEPKPVLYDSPAVEIEPVSEPDISTTEVWQEAAEPQPEYQTEAEAELAEAPAARVQLGHVFVAAAASGGAGKTFFATNLATYLAKVTEGRVVLIDLDLQFGEVAMSLRLRPERTIADLVEEDDLEATLEDYLVDYRAGFKVLCAPKDPLAGERVGPAEAAAVVDAAQKLFDYVVVDTSDALNETSLAAFDKAQTLVVIASMDLPSLKNVRVFLETLEKLSIPVNETPLVINKVESGIGVDLAKLEPIYPQGFSMVLPYSKSAALSSNVGVPVLERDPQSEISCKLAGGFLKWVAPSSGVALPWTPPQKTRRWFSTSAKGASR